jgi:activator of 2-hydroxyglutaryl-CoA dehydratase
LNGLNGDRIQNALNVYYQEVIAALVESLRTQISAAQRLPRLDQAIPLVVSGGTAMPKGFVEQFGRALRASDFPVPISEIRISADALNSTARGALMAALC